MAKTSKDSLIDMKSVAAELGLSYETVRRLTAAGAIQSIRIGRSYRFRQGAVEKFLETREIGGRA